MEGFAEVFDPGTITPMDNFLMSPLAPWLIALAVVLAGGASWIVSVRCGRRLIRRALRALSVLVLAIGLVMTAGAVYTAIRMTAIRRANPPPGTMVEVNGTRLHVWCEGPATRPTVLLLPGGYGQALWMRHLQEGLALDHRVCLIDRAGLGWSDSRPLPNGVERVVEEMRDALAAAGEDFPMVIVGHSFGGLYAADFAAIYPHDVAGIVLLDPTAPSHNIARADNECPGPDYATVLGAMYGLGFNRRLNPLFGPGVARERELAGDDWGTLVAFEIRPSALLGASSAFNAPCRRPLSTVPATPGRLGDLPVLQIVQEPEPSEGRPPWLDHLTDFEYANYRELFDAARDDYVRMSGRSRLEYAPPGAGHDFPATEREFTLGRIRAFVAELVSGTFQTAPPAEAAE